ncbi:MAG: DNA translocase FtsK 4TM domain-containing protein [Lachnospiraceae bacterium]|nr:DNA translocase FtsK 4TM domain-containing protein [Lachnospiraceae bacterium]
MPAERPPRIEPQRSGRTRTERAAEREPRPTLREEYEGSFIPREIVLLIAFAAAVLLVLSNFHLCGKIGDLLYSVMHGLFGIFGYLFPVLLFGIAFFLVANPRSIKAKIKAASTVVLFWLLCGFAQLVAGNFDPSVTYGGYYELGQKGLTGGFFGGLWTKTMLPVFSAIGTGVILLVLMAIALVLISERSLIGSVKDGAVRAKNGAQEFHMRHQAAQARERIRRRAEQQHTGVSMDTDLNPDGQVSGEILPEAAPLPSLKEEAAQNPVSAAAAAAAQPAPEVDPMEEILRRFDDDNWKKPAQPVQPGPAVTPVRPVQTAAPVQPVQTAAPVQPVRPRDLEIPVRPEELPPPEVTEEPPVEVHSLKELAGYVREDPTGQIHASDVTVLPVFSDGREKGAIDLSGRRGGFFSVHAVETTDNTEYKPKSNIVYGDVPESSEKAYREIRRREEERFEPDDTAPPAESSGSGASIDRPIRPQPGDVTPAASVRPAGPAAASAEPAQTPYRPVNDPGQTVQPVQRPAYTERPADPVRPVQAPIRPQEQVIVDYDPRMSEEKAGAPAQDPDIIRKTTASGKVIEVEKKESIFSDRRSGESSSSGKTFGGQPRTQGAAAAQPAKPVQTPPPVKKKPRRPYVAPSLNLLKQGDKNNGGMTKEALRETASKLQSTLQSFGVGVRITDISCGPTVTRYELQPDQGVKVSKITQLQDDIKLSLAAADVRIEAPIPGKSAVGIEVPNSTNQTVFLRDILESEAFRKHPSKVAFAVGRDIGGQAVVTDISRMPHLLIAGATGSGKSICINTLIMSILYKASPEQVKLIMIDPKVVELGIYNGIPHLMVPVVTDPKKASGALKWAVAEMTDRYRKFAELNVRDLRSYNEKMREKRAEGDTDAAELPMVVIIVDEFADLMMVAPGEVEDSVCRLAQMARAAGMHLVLATQRPSVNVITGLIKANVPSRIALACSSSIDSRTILDMVGAERLLGKGDMLFFPQGYQKPVRVQGAFVSDSEIEAVVESLKDRNGEAEYDPEMTARMDQLTGDGGTANVSGPDDDRDELFAAAGFTIIEMEKASIGMLQRKFKIGFNRAARIMDQLAEEGVVGPEEGTKARQILMTRAQFEDYLDAQG